MNTQQISKVGLLGGSFDPPHLAHWHLAQAARTALGLDRIIFIPTNIPPHKQGILYADAHDRLAMLRAMLYRQEGFEISDMELTREGPSYTLDTVNTFHSLYPDENFYFIIGGDSLMYMENWYRADELMQRIEFIVAYRPGDHMDEFLVHKKYLETNFGARITLIEAPVLDISSTAVRTLCAQGADISHLVMPSVQEYIQAHGLYQENADERA